MFSIGFNLLCNIFDSVISSYNSSSSQWDVIISKQIVKQSPFFVVSALQNDVLFGCTIASTTVFSKYATTSDANFFRIISEGVDSEFYSKYQLNLLTQGR